MFIKLSCTSAVKLYMNLLYKKNGLVSFYQFSWALATGINNSYHSEVWVFSLSCNESPCTKHPSMHCICLDHCQWSRLAMIGSNFLFGLYCSQTSININIVAELLFQWKKLTVGIALLGTIFYLINGLSWP